MASRYVVLYGEAGVGKSTIVEKLTGQKGLSSDNAQSFTLVSKSFDSWDNQLEICDTPGINSLVDRFEHNVNVAHALNHRPVSCILIVVRALPRLESVVEKVSNLTFKFLPEDLPEELVSVCVTHMDEVKWDKDLLVQTLDEHTGITHAVTSSLNTIGKDLQADILKVCVSNPVSLTIDSDLFLKLFDFSKSHGKVLRDVNREKNKFERVKRQFFENRGQACWSENDKRDMTFEFQAWMLEEITQAQKRVSEKNNFTFDGPEVECQAGHIANMTNQLRKILYDVRIDAMKYHKNLDSGFRKCPHCSTIWAKVEGCDGETTCGNRVSRKWDDWSGGITANFAFVWDMKYTRLHVKKRQLDDVDGQSDNVDEKLDDREKQLKERINKQRNWRNIKWDQGNARGCGKTITWSGMAPVPVPVEFQAVEVSTDDVPLLEKKHLPKFREHFNLCLAKISSTVRL